MSLLIHGEVRNSLDTLAWWEKRCPGSPTWLETERQEGVVRKAGRPALWVVSGAGVRAFMVPKRRKSREAQKAKLC